MIVTLKRWIRTFLQHDKYPQYRIVGIHRWGFKSRVWHTEEHMLWGIYSKCSELSLSEDEARTRWCQELARRTQPALQRIVRPFNVDECI